jgi:ATP-dependent DNA helicase RecG
MKTGARWTIAELKASRESEDKLEFKRGEGGNVSYDGGTRTEPAKRRRCILGYVVALCNEQGGSLVIGMDDRHPHAVTGTRQNENAIGELEADIYRDTGIRPSVYELYEDETAKTGRVLVIDVPSRPIGKVYKFEDVPLMRVGEELKPMSDECYCRIVQEQEPDFSQQICPGAARGDLDEEAIRVMREKYARKQHNDKFLTLGAEQILNDLELMVDGRLTNAAVILLGREPVIKRLMPQAAVMLEYRASEAQIPFDNRVVYRKPFFLMIDELWHDINLRNGGFPVNEGSYIFTVPYFNEEVIREAVNNAVAHRDYRRSSETLIKLYPQRMIVVNAGGFPHGVTLANLLTVPSTPRNRLLADVLSKTGVVERSGQGVDKIFYDTLSEGKAEPDYSNSDDFKVELNISAALKDRGFALFIESVQQTLSNEMKLSVFEILTLTKIRDGVHSSLLDKKVVTSLLERKLIEQIGRTRGTSYILSRSYYDFTGDSTEYFRRTGWSESQMFALIRPYLEQNGSAKLGDFEKLLDGHLTRRQIRVYVQKMMESGVLTSTGERAGMRYQLSASYVERENVYDEALKIGLEELSRRNCPKSVQGVDGESVGKVLK